MSLRHERSILVLGLSCDFFNFQILSYRCLDIHSQCGFAFPFKVFQSNFVKMHYIMTLYVFITGCVADISLLKTNGK